MLSVTEKLEVIEKFKRAEKDTGSPEVQVALLTKRIEKLAPHFEGHKHDHSSKRGLMKLIGQRRRLLRYLAKNDDQRYRTVLKGLGLRK